MDIAFFMGLVGGVLIGLGISMLICKHVKLCVYEAIVDALNCPTKKRDLLEEPDGTDWWKPKGWRPHDE